MKPRLIFADEREEVVEGLQQEFDGCEEVKAICLPPAQLRRLENLDALYLSLPYAERWGAKPILYKAQVLKTRGKEEGMPPFVIAGGAFHPDQMRDEKYELRQVITSVFDAVETFNRESPEKILTVGFWTEISPLQFNRVSPKEAGQIIREMYEDWIQAAA